MVVKVPISDTRRNKIHNNRLLKIEKSIHLKQNKNKIKNILNFIQTFNVLTNYMIFNNHHQCYNN